MTSQSIPYNLETQLIMSEVVQADFSIFLFHIYQIICQYPVFSIFNIFFLWMTFMNDPLSSVLKVSLYSLLCLFLKILISRILASRVHPGLIKSEFLEVGCRDQYFSKIPKWVQHTVKSGNLQITHFYSTCSLHIR